MWVISASSKASIMSTTHTPLESKPLPEDDVTATTPTTTDGARVASASSSTNYLLHTKVRPRYRRYGPTVLTHTVTPASSSVF